MFQPNRAMHATPPASRAAPSALTSCTPAPRRALDDSISALFSRTGANGHVQVTGVEDKVMRDS
eukprot:scaffold12492_cov98-Isochrysis_galbana.AAC.6